MTLTKIVNGKTSSLGTEEEQAELARWAYNDAVKHADESNTGYQFLRSAQYPQIADQLDMLWKSMDKGEIPKAIEFYDALKTVKDKFPKPTTPPIIVPPKKVK